MRTATSLAGLGLAAQLGLCACSNESLDVANTNAPTVEQISGTPSRATLARLAVGAATALLNDVVGAQVTEISLYAILGREGWNLQGNDPRATGECLRGPLGAGDFGGFFWFGKFQALRTMNTYLAAIERAVDLSAAEKAASTGYAQTLKAQLFHRLIVRNGKLGAPIRVESSLNQPPAPFESEANVYAYLVALLDSARTSLQAGGSAFPFPVLPDLAAFPTPGDFIKLNRGLLAKVRIHQATLAGCGTPCFQAALTALGESFLTVAGLPGSLRIGANYAYSAASGDFPNPIAEPLTRDRLYVHPSYQTDAQRKADGEPDDRFTTKVRAGTPKSLTQPSGTLSGVLKPILYNVNTPTASDPDLGADIPWLKNEELILLRAEANLGVGNLQAAIDDINLIRIHSGGLPPTSLTPASGPAILTELLYNRRYSLMWEQGTRWIDARRYGRLNTLPLDRPGDVTFPNLLVSAAECNARGLPAPCDPLSEK